MAYLAKLWDHVRARAGEVPPGSVVHEDLPLWLRVLRDELGRGVSRVLVDSPREHERMQQFAAAFMPEAAPVIELYAGARPILDLNGVEEELAKALDRKVPLKSGGHLVIDQTEAMTTIDVNTGAYVGHRHLEETIFRTNLEIAMTHIGTGVHVDGGHRLGLVDHQVAAGLQRHLAVERLGDLLLDAVQVEYRARAGVQFDDRRRLGHEGGGELLHTLVLARRIDQHAAHAAAELIAQHPQAEGQILVDHRAGGHLAGTRAHVIPQPGAIGPAPPQGPRR